MFMSLSIRGVVSVTVVALLMVKSISAQWSGGVLTGSAASISVAGTGSATDGTSTFHGNGFGGLAPQLFPATNAASPDLRRVLQQFGAVSALDLDDYSSGMDDILVDENGVLAIEPWLWSVWSFSLRQGAQGEVGSRIQQEAQSGNVASALFSFVLPGSALPSEVVGVVERSHSGDELGVPGASVELDGVDQPLVLGTDQGLAAGTNGILEEPGMGPLRQSPPTLLFTVSDSTKGLVPTSWWGGTQPSGATIFYVQWLPFGAWTPPSVFASYADLGLDVDEDIDALAVDLTSEKVLYSTTGTARDQFLFGDLSSDLTQPLPVLRTSGEILSGSIGKASGDDIDAICTLDPALEFVNLMPPNGDLFGSSCGAPRDGVLGTVPELSGSAYRRYSGASAQTFFETFLVGWPSASGATPSLALCFLTTGDNIDPVIVDVQVRDTSNATNGDPRTAAIGVPPSLSLLGDRFTLRWFNLEWSTAAITEAWPVQIFL
jgi:hypothetical protein